MEQRQVQVRIMVLRAAVLVAMAVLLGRLWYLQVARWATWARRAEMRRTDVTWTPAPRGTIFDRHGEALAGNRVVYQVTVNWAALPRDEAELGAALVPLARVLNVSTVKAREALEKARALGGSEAVLPEIGDDIDRLQAIRLDERRFEMPGIRVVEARQRYYSRGPLAAQLLGYARGITPLQYAQVRDLTYDTPLPGADERLLALAGRQAVYARTSTFGQKGVEAMCELVRLNGRLVPALHGRPGADEAERDSRGRLHLIRRLPPVPGASVFLTIDRRLQEVAERSLAHPFVFDRSRTPEGGAAVVVDVQTGEVLVMANYPAIDLNRFVSGFAPAEWAAIANDPRHPEYNRSIAGRYPPASTFKMISGCAILECTGMTLNTTYVCRGPETFGRRDRKTCWKPAGHGPVDFEQGVAQSCDVYFWDAVKHAGLAPEDIADYARRFGMGQLTGVGLAGEVEGRVPTPESRKAGGGGRWYQGDTANMVIGQGEVQVTPLQLALVTAAVGNGGLLPRARVVRKIVWPSDTGLGTARWTEAAPQRIDVKPETLEAVRRGMRATVTSRRGTARGPMSGTPVPVGAKTGSAEDPPHEKPHSWFVWFAPYDRPRYACAVVVEHAGHGAEVAGFVARDILFAMFAQTGPTASPTAEDVLDAD